MANNITTPHDRFFRSMMSDRNLIQDFFKENLPQKISDIIDFESISPQKDSFINDHLRLQVADILYSVEFNGEPGYLYLLVEHQSTPCKLMPFRILKYMVAIMEHHLKKTGDDQLPVIYPMIIYNGKKRYGCSTDLFDLFGDKKQLVKEILWQPYHLIDLSQIPDEELRKSLQYGTAMFTMKHIYEKEFLPILKVIVGSLKLIEKKGYMGYIYTILSYVVEASEIDREDFVNTVKSGLSEISGEKIMTLAEQFRKEGLDKGKAEGKAEGKAVGKTEAFNLVAMRLFDQGMIIDQISAVTGLSVKEIEQLKNKKMS